MSEHNYSRELVGGSYNINNILKVDGEGTQIDLYKDINADEDFSHKFNIECNMGDCRITFNFDLSAPQLSKLDTIVNNHKNYS